MIDENSTCILSDFTRIEVLVYSELLPRIPRCDFEVRAFFHSAQNESTQLATYLAIWTKTNRQNHE